MGILPFYNHYLQKDNPTFEILSESFLQENIYLREYPCICSDQTTLVGKVGLIHGDRKIESDCYLAIKQRIETNPSFNFFIFGLSLGRGKQVLNDLHEKIGDYPNYAILVSSTIKSETSRMIDLIKKDKIQIS
jgi:hypothetical protein